MFGSAVARKKIAAAAEQRVRLAAPLTILPDAWFSYAQRLSKFGCDIVQAHRANENRLIFALIDVAGQRAGNSGIADAVRQNFQRDATLLFSAADINESEALSQLARDLNRSLMARGARFAAAFLACYEASTGALWYINAGHTPALIYDEAFRELGASGVPLGLFSHAIHDAQITVLQPQSVFLLLSKGVVEIRAGRPQLRLASAKDLVAKRFATADELVSAVLEMAEASANSRSLEQNDRTAVALIRGELKIRP